MKRLLIAVLMVVTTTSAYAGGGFSWSGYGRASVGAVRTLAQLSVPVSVGGTLAETTLATYNLPAGAMGLNGGLRIRALYSNTNSSVTKNLRIRFGGTLIVASGATTTASAGFLRTIHNRNSASLQVTETQSTFSPGYVGSASAVVTTTVDTSAAVPITFLGTSALETGFTPSPTSNISGSNSLVTVISTAHGLNTGEFIKASGSSTGGYNVDPVAITRVDANTFTYAGTGSGTPGTAPLIQRYSVVTLEGYTIELLPGSN
jgi:hypothetical protein